MSFTTCIVTPDCALFWCVFLAEHASIVGDTISSKYIVNICIHLLYKTFRVSNSSIKLFIIKLNIALVVCINQLHPSVGRHPAILKSLAAACPKKRCDDEFRVNVLEQVH